MQQVELTTEDLQVLSQENRVRILSGQIENGRAELKENYATLEAQKLHLSDLEFKIRELTADVIEERKKLQAKEKANAALEDELRNLRDLIAQKEGKLKSLSIDQGKAEKGATNAEIERLVSQLNKEEANVLKYQAAIERRRNELASIDHRFQAETEQMSAELDNLVETRKKTMDIISLETQRLQLLRQRNEAAIRMLASRSIDSNLTEFLESLAD